MYKIILKKKFLIGLGLMLGSNLVVGIFRFQWILFFVSVLAVFIGTLFILQAADEIHKGKEAEPDKQ